MEKETKDKLIIPQIQKVSNKEYEKFSIDEILERKDLINKKEAAEELIEWLKVNVPNFIDNKERLFKIDLVVAEESKENIENIKLLQDLYRGIKEDSFYIGEDGNNKTFEEITEEDLKDVMSVRGELDKITEEINEYILKSEKLKELFDVMVFYYELSGINKGKLVLKELTGSVSVSLQYDSFDVGVKVIDSITKETCKEYIIPEGFSVSLEIAFRDVKRSISSLF
jgi:hypothetical protein